MSARGSSIAWTIWFTFWLITAKVFHGIATGAAAVATFAERYATPKPPTDGSESGPTEPPIVVRNGS